MSPTIIIILLAAAHLNAQSDRFGLPACAGPDLHFVQGTVAVICYDSARKVPIWSAYELNADRVVPSTGRRKHFRPDPRISGPSAHDADYRNSPFARGHMVPAADVAWNEDAFRESFYLSNAAPQNPSLNSGKWRVIETRVRHLAKRSDAVVVLTGPVFCANTRHIGSGQVAVPCGLFKVVLSVHADKLAMFASVLPNDRNPAEPLAAFAVSVREVENLTSLDFFPALPAVQQAALESSTSPLP
ncbi:MAG: DNA/RNA non-specific endonuclease [Acidobacteria bacterium]|nr:DNA/RNA non-specific endonuclease [Acidobacteriota bacterium]